MAGAVVESVASEPARRFGAVMTVQHIADLEPARRTAILVAQTADLETRLADARLRAAIQQRDSLRFENPRNTKPAM